MLPDRRTLAGLVLCCGVAALQPSLAAAQDAPQVKVVEFGEYTVSNERPRPDLDSGSSGVTERIYSEGAKLLRRTNRVEARLCVRFGVWFQLAAPDAGRPIPVTARLTHPLLVRPDGQSGTVELDASVLDGEPSLSGFSFDHPWEAAPGTWTFAILSGGKVLAEQSFEVVAPTGAGGAGTGRCEAVTS